MLSVIISDPASGSFRSIESLGRDSSQASVWDNLPTLSRRRARLTRKLMRLLGPGRFPASLRWFEEWLGSPLDLGTPDVIDRASGIKRGGLVAQLSLPGMGTRIGLGVEIPMAHAVVDRLLGFDRPLAESRLQLSPVEWGIWTFIFVKALDQLKADAGPGNSRSLGDPIPWLDLRLDRVGPDPFDTELLGNVFTICWTTSLGGVSGTVRLWLPEVVVDRWLRSTGGSDAPEAERVQRFLGAGSSILPAGKSTPAGSRELSSEWRARGGITTLPRGLNGLRAGVVLPIFAEDPAESPQDASERIELVCSLGQGEGSFRISARPAAGAGTRSLIVTSTVRRVPPALRETSAVNSDLDAGSPTAGILIPGQPTNLPVTLTVELGRVNLTLTRLADLKPGDIVELSRNTREPVELTSNGRIVARGELIKIDTDLGVRITNIFL